MSKLSDTKHNKYFTAYKPGDTFWGIGIENETYLELPNQPKVSGKFIQESHKSERYSVDYYKTYLKNFFKKAVATQINTSEEYALPVLINSHFLTACDPQGEHATTFEKSPKPNPKFQGKTNFQILKESNPYFEKEQDNSYCFDGDTVEFMTLNFYKTNVKDTIKELIHSKKEFLNHINAAKPEFCKGEKLKYPPENYGFVRMATNPKNLAIFNNGTYHFNFTLPTKLNSSGDIENWNNFTFRHKKAIRFIQFLEPFFIAVYGSGDVLSKTAHGLRFPAGSQRCAASRYISVGTYDTTQKELITGKLLQEDRELLQKKWAPYHWYNQLYAQINYKKGDKVGFDINFNKFKNHGIEIRFFDWFPEQHLEKVLTVLVHILDIAESTPNLPKNPLDSEIWHNITYKAIWKGKKAILTKDELTYVKSYFGIKKIRCKSLDFDCVFEELAECLKTRFGVKGPVSQFMLTPPPKVTIIEQVGLSSCSLWCLPKTAATQTSTSGTSPRNSEQPQK